MAARRSVSPVSTKSFHPLLLAVAAALAVVAAVAVWRYGTLSVLGDPAARAAAAGLAAFIVLGLGAWAARRSVPRTAPATAEPTADPAGVSLTALHRQARLAMGHLGIRRSAWRGEGRAPYRRAWYLVVGAAAAGKTALIRSMADVRDVDEASEGVAHWRIAADAVFVDTAGDGAIPDSRSSGDARLWSALLILLKAARPRRPINAILLAVSIPDLVAWTAVERRVHAQAIRRRLTEARRRLGVRLPVHVLLTKADRLAGFGAFFDAATDEERRTAWGMTFPTDAKTAVGERVAEAFAGMVGRLAAGLSARLHQEPDPRVRAAAFGFPPQVAALEERLADLLGIAWADELGFDPPLLRGVYLTSAGAVQTEAPVDALALDLPPPLDPTAVEVGAKPHFVARLLPDVLLPEADLVGEDRTLARRRFWRRGLAFAAMLTMGVALGAFWYRSYVGNLALIVRADAAAAQVEDALRRFDTPPRSLTTVQDTDFAALLPVLDAMRDLPGGYAERDRWPSPALMGGLYQGGKLGVPAQAMYARALRAQLLSRILLRLEDGMRAAWLRPDDLQAAYRAYLMIGGRLPLDRTHVADWMAADWARTLPGPEAGATRQALGQHLEALFDLGFAAVPLDDALVDRARKTLEEESSAVSR